MGFFRRKDRQHVVGLYGKHPDAGDFLRYQTSGPRLQVLDQWLASALSVAERRVPAWSTVFDSSPPLCFCIRIEAKGAGLLLGALAPSRDRIGRRFPLVLFCEAPLSPLIGGYPALPHHLFFEQIKALLERRASIGTEELLHAVHQLQPFDPAGLDRARSRHHRYLERNDCGSAFSSIFGLNHLVQQGRALLALRQACATVSDSVPRFGIRCPLGRKPTAETGLWLQLQQVSTPAAIVPNLLWGRDAMVIYFSQLSAKALAVAWQSDWQDDTIWDLATSQPKGRAGVEIEPQMPLRTLVEGGRAGEASRPAAGIGETR